MGHLVAFGCTEEKLIHTIFGCKERGMPSDGAFRHATGEGWVKAHKGHYHDALHVKKNMTVGIIADDFGGVTGYTDKQLRRWEKRAKDGRDGTKYGRSRTSTRSFYVHHTQRIATAAQQFDARGIRKAIVFRKQELMKGLTGAP